MLNANKNYKGLPARSRRKIQTRCHLHGNLYCLGEERPLTKDIKSLADIATRLLGMHEKQSLSHTGPEKCPSRKLSSSLSSSEHLAGGKAGRQPPRHRLSESNLVAKRNDAKTSDKAWRRRQARAPRHPFRLRDITEADPHGPDVLLLIPLKLRDGKHALSGICPPLASILLASSLRASHHPVRGSTAERGKKHCKGS